MGKNERVGAEYQYKFGKLPNGFQRQSFYGACLLNQSLFLIDKIAVVILMNLATSCEARRRAQSLK